MKKRGWIYVLTLMGIGAAALWFFFWPKPKRVYSIDFNIPTDDVTAEDFIIKAESISGSN